MTKKIKKETYKINNLLQLAMKYLNSLEGDDEIAKRNETDLFYYELYKIYENKELININVNGTVAKGKSTVAIALCKWILENCLGKEMSIKNIARTQIEASKMMRDKDFHDTVIVIDEWDTMEEGGANATAESGLMKHMSDVHAQRNNHRISCSPKEDVDANADIYIEVIQADKDKEKTLCHLYFKVFKAGIEHKQIVGYIEINVKDVLKEGYYTEYRERKFNKMNLMTEHGIFRARTLDYSKIIWITAENLKPLAERGEINRELIKNYLEMISREHKIPTTMLGKNEWVEEIIGLLSPYKQIYKRYLKIDALMRQRRKDPENTKIPVMLHAERKIIEDLTEMIKKQTEEYVTRIRIAKAYN